MPNYPIKLNIRLDWSEMDMFRHINNVSYFKYIQASRVHYWETVGLTQLHADMGIGPMLASTGCDFKQPLFYPGDIVIEASVEFLKTTSFGIAHRILNSEGKVAAEANDVMVLYDFNKHEKVTIPQHLRDKITSLEGKDFDKA